MKPPHRYIKSWATLAPQALIEVLDHLEEGKYPPQAQQNEFSNYAEKLSKEEAKLDWSLPAVQLERCIRAFNPWPISWLQTTDAQGKQPNIESLSSHCVAASKSNSRHCVASK